MKNPPRWVAALASLELTLFCLILMMVLVVIGTLAQVHLGTFAAQRLYFSSFWLRAELGDWRIPIFPGGLTVGGLWLVNLVASFIARFKYNRKHVGLLLSHFGLICLVAGQGMTQILARETQMPIEVGHSRNYVESGRDMELAVIKTSDPDLDEVKAIPYSVYSHEGEIHPPGLPFYLVIRRFMRNAQLGMASSGVHSLATQGIGMQIDAREIPPVYGDDEANTITAFVEAREVSRSLGVWLVSSGLGAPQVVHAGGADYRLTMRPRRYYLPYTLTLKEFRHDIYPGTDIPKNFSSLVHLSDPGKHESRDVLIYMNHPLRYQGKTFYQASFGEGDRLSVFQVVDNPFSASPYIACALVVLGLAIQFLSHLMDFSKRQA